MQKLSTSNKNRKNLEKYANEKQTRLEKYTIDKHKKKY